MIRLPEGASIAPATEDAIKYIIDHPRPLDTETVRRLGMTRDEHLDAIMSARSQVVSFKGEPVLYFHALKHPEADQLARALARVTGLSLTEAIMKALREQLARETGRSTERFRKVGVRVLPGPRTHPTRPARRPTSHFCLSHQNRRRLGVSPLGQVRPRSLRRRAGHDAVWWSLRR